MAKAKSESAKDLEPAPRGSHRGRGVLLWLLALLLMFAAIVYQRLTGPTHPRRGSFTAAGAEHHYRLVRSGWSTAPARVSIPDPGAGVEATLHWRRYKTGDEFTATAMSRQKGELVGLLPAQPAAGKLEYFLRVRTPEGEVRIPPAEAGEGAEPENIIIRFKDEVPGLVLWPHVVLMFLSVLIGLRAGLAALFQPAAARRLSWTTLAGMTAGGMILGPCVQKYAFGAFWTGFPFGYDLTDNKMLILWIVWVVACAVVGARRRRPGAGARAAVLAAAVAMIVVYLIPHSMRGSELDYSKLGRGVPASEAIGTGD